MGKRRSVKPVETFLFKSNGLLYLPKRGNLGSVYFLPFSK